MNTDDRLRAKLIEDTGSAEEADRLLPVMQHLADWPAPTPSAAETARLMPILQREMQPTPSIAQKYAELLFSQARIVQQEIWIASALVISLGVALTFLIDDRAMQSGSIFAFLAPIVTAICITFLYGPATDPALEIELATPTSARLMLIARLALVFGFNLILALLGSVVLAVTRSDISLGLLIATWLAPMTFLAALAFLTSLLFNETLLSALASLVLWGIQVLHLFGMPNLPLPNFLSSETRPWLWLFALAFGTIAIWLAGRNERWLSSESLRRLN
jgi:hypothetical protein